MFGKDEDITHEAVMKKLSEIIAVRGKKGTKRSEQVCLAVTSHSHVSQPRLAAMYRDSRDKPIGDGGAMIVKLLLVLRSFTCHHLHCLS